MVEGLVEPAVVEQAEEVEHEAADDDALDRRGAALRADQLVEREHERHADDEHEEGEDEVVDVEADPLRVVELVREELRDAVGEDAGEAVNDFFAAEDPDHVEAAEGVEGDEAAGLVSRERVGRLRGGVIEGRARRWGCGDGHGCRK